MIIAESTGSGALHLDVEYSDDDGTSSQRVVLPHNTPVGDQYGEHMTVDGARCFWGLTCGRNNLSGCGSGEHCLNKSEVKPYQFCKATDQISMMEQFGGEQSPHKLNVLQRILCQKKQYTSTLIS